MTRIGASIALLGLFGLEPARPVVDPVGQCQALVAAERHEEAVLRREQVFEETGDPRAGLATGQALLALGDTDSALAWAKPFQEGTEAANSWQLTAQAHSKRKDLERDKEANLRELPLRIASGEHARAADLAYRRFWFANAAANYREALAFARQSLEEAMSSEEPQLEGRALQAVFVVLYEVGDSHRALRLLPKMKALPAAENRCEWARILVFEGLLWLGSGHRDLAQVAFEKAVAMADPSDCRQILHSAHVNLIRIALELGDSVRADREMEAARQHADPTQEPASSVRYYEARLLEESGQFAEAAKLLRETLAAEFDPVWRRDLEYRLGVVEEARGDLTSAELAYQRSAKLAEEVVLAASRDEIRSVLTEDNRQPFEALFRLLSRSGRVLEAIEIVESVQAMGLLGSILDGASQPVTEGEEATAIGRAAALQMASLEALLPSASESPLMSSRSLDKALRQLEDRRLLAYFEAGEEIWLVILSAEGAEVLLLDARLSRVRKLVERFRESPDDSVVADELGEMLLPGGALASPGRLLIATDGVLGELPFAALRRHGRFLVEDYSLAYVPSASALAAIETRPLSQPGPAAVVLADPRGDLAEAALEGHHVAARLKVTPQLGSDATRARLREAAHADILHLATHTGLGPQGAWLALHDGKLAAERIITERIGPQLVVLAGCASAARSGRGMWGSLGSAFLLAGSRTVVASLWSVEDSAARELVQRFYDRGGADAPAAALAAAQRDLIAAGRPVSEWAPFVVLGSDLSPKFLY